MTETKTAPRGAAHGGRRETGLEDAQVLGPGAENLGQSRQPPWPGPGSQGDCRQGRQQRRPKSQTHLALLQRLPVRARTDNSEDRSLPKRDTPHPLPPTREVKAGRREQRGHALDTRRDL